MARYANQAVLDAQIRERDATAQGLRSARNALWKSTKQLHKQIELSGRDMTDDELALSRQNCAGIEELDKALEAYVGGPTGGRQTGVDCSLPLGKSLGTHKANGAFLEEVGGSGDGDEYASILDLCAGIYQAKRYHKLDRRLDHAYNSAQSIGVGSEGGYGVPTALLERALHVNDGGHPFLMPWALLCCPRMRRRSRCGTIRVMRRPRHTASISPSHKRTKKSRRVKVWKCGRLLSTVRNMPRSSRHLTSG